MEMLNPEDRAIDSVTSVTLLARLQSAPADKVAWTEFVDRYGDRIHGWCRRWGLQDADAHDVAQNVLFKVLRAMQTFRYDPSQKFRAWLKTITHHAWQDVVRSRRKMIAEESEEIAASDNLLETLAARDDLQGQLEAAYEQELFDSAVARVRPRVQPLTWEAFRLTALEGLSGANASSRLKMPVTSIYKAKSNILKLLEAEVRYLDGG